MTPRFATPAIAFLLASAGAAGAAEPIVSYERVPWPAMAAYDMSPDGRFVVGSTDTDGDLVPDGGFLWDRLTGTLTILPSGTLDVAAVSDDGSVLLGDVPDPVTMDPQVGTRAGLWTEAGGWQEIGFLPNAGECPSRSSGYELSGDGSVAVGLSWESCSGRGFVWTQADGMLPLEFVGVGGNRASVVSADGSVIAGFAQGTFNRTPAIWDGATRDGFVLDLSLQGEFNGISDDGSVLLGSVYMGAPDGVFDAVRWTAAGGLEVLGAGSLLSGWAGGATDIADDGTVIGFDRLFGNRRAWILPPGASAQVLLADWAEDRGADVLGDELWVATTLSSDGSVACGFGFNFGDGAFAPWVITITAPCPADCDSSGTLSLDDIDCFIGAFLSSDLAADCDANGILNLDDLDCFVASFLSGCL